MNVLFVHNCLQRFVATDLDLLREKNRVVELDFHWSPSTVCRLVPEVVRCDLVFGWFAGHHVFAAAALARVLGKRVIMAASDYDLANEPWFGYGSMRGGVRKWIGNHVFLWSDLVLVPSDFSRKLAIQNTVLKTFPDKLRVVPHGFVSVPLPTVNKEKFVVTVGVLNSENWIRKGHREFIEVARRMPRIKFYLVGRPSPSYFLEWVKHQAPPNLEVTGFLSDVQLSDLLARAKVYVQLSYMEGFGCSVAEAMLAECVPVVTRSGSLPEVVGGCGYYVDYGDIPASCAAVQSALEDSHFARLARARIIEHFPLSRRRQAINSFLNEASQVSRQRLAPDSHSRSRVPNTIASLRKQ